MLTNEDREKAVKNLRMIADAAENGEEASLQRWILGSWVAWDKSNFGVFLEDARDTRRAPVEGYVNVYDKGFGDMLYRTPEEARKNAADYCKRAAVHVREVEA